MSENSRDALFDCIKFICQLDAIPVPDASILDSVLCGDKHLVPKTAIVLFK